MQNGRFQFPAEAEQSVSSPREVPLLSLLEDLPDTELPRPGGLLVEDPALRYYPAALPCHDAGLPLTPACSCCVGADRGGVLRRIPKEDLRFRRGPAVLTCSACNDAFVRAADGAW